MFFAGNLIHVFTNKWRQFLAKHNLAIIENKKFTTIDLMICSPPIVSIIRWNQIIIIPWMITFFDPDPVFIITVPHIIVIVPLTVTPEILLPGWGQRFSLLKDEIIVVEGTLWEKVLVTQCLGNFSHIWLVEGWYTFTTSWCQLSSFGRWLVIFLQCANFLRFVNETGYLIDS